MRLPRTRGPWTLVLRRGNLQTQECVCLRADKHRAHKGGPGKGREHFQTPGLAVTGPRGPAGLWESPAWFCVSGCTRGIPSYGTLAHPEIPKTGALGLGCHENHPDILKLCPRLGPSPGGLMRSVWLGPERGVWASTSDPTVWPGLRPDTAGSGEIKGLFHLNDPHPTPRKIYPTFSKYWALGRESSVKTKPAAIWPLCLMSTMVVETKQRTPPAHERKGILTSPSNFVLFQRKTSSFK